jgi:hypothetical protein
MSAAPKQCYYCLLLEAYTMGEKEWYFRPIFWYFQPIFFALRVFSHLVGFFIFPRKISSFFLVKLEIPWKNWIAKLALILPGRSSRH